MGTIQLLTILTFVQGRYSKKQITPPPSHEIKTAKTKYPHKSCQKKEFFSGRGWDTGRSSPDEKRYRVMKRFGKATTSILYNLQSEERRRIWCNQEVQERTEKALRTPLRDCHPDPVCRQLLAEEDKKVLKHVIYHVVREFKAGPYRLSKHDYCKDVPQEWIPQEYIRSLQEWIGQQSSAADLQAPLRPFRSLGDKPSVSKKAPTSASNSSTPQGDTPTSSSHTLSPHSSPYPERPDLKSVCFNVDSSEGNALLSNCSPSSNMEDGNAIEGFNTVPDAPIFNADNNEFDAPDFSFSNNAEDNNAMESFVRLLVPQEVSMSIIAKVMPRYPALGSAAILKAMMPWKDSMRFPISQFLTLITASMTPTSLALIATLKVTIL